MSQSRRRTLLRSQNDFLRILRLTLWAVPALMGLIGAGYTLVEHQQRLTEPVWPLPTVLGVLIRGFVGPVVAWICLLWVIKAAKAYLAAQERLEHRAEELATLNKLSVAAGRSLDLDKRIATILDHTIDALDAAAGMIFVQEDGRPGLGLEAHRGISANMARQEARLAPGYCLCGQAVLTRRVLFASDVGNDRRCTSDLCICEGFRSVACAPLEVKGHLVGLLHLASPNVGHFADDQRDFLSAVAAQVSVSIENARLYDAVQAFNTELEQKIKHRTGELEAARWSLAEKALQLQRLLSESYRIQEDTQARIARDMHDGVTQIIIGALYETEAARQLLVDDPDRAAENLARAQALLAEAETEIRRVIYDLHPPVLDMMGLVVALKRFATTFTATFGIDCRVQVATRPRRLSKESEVAVYRIIQAALHNVATHARANQACVHFDFDADLQVVVEDDGIGFDPETTLATVDEHLGLVGMRERAEALGATLTVVSEPGEGTQIKLRLPSPPYLDQDGE